MKTYLIVPCVAAAIAAGQVAALLWSRDAEAQQAPEWRDLGGMNGVELYAVTDRGTRCYVTSAGGVSCK